MKLTLNNFQIFEGEHTFEFFDGINVVVGPNASGKSSMFYAIENLLCNPNGVDDCVHWDHKQAKVTMENNNNSVTWIRNLGSSQYINNVTGQSFIKASKLDSTDIADLGFYFDNKGKIVNIHNEWSVIFPFGESDTDMFRLFEDIFNISCSFQVIDEMKKDESYIKSNLNNTKAEIGSVKDKLKVIQGIQEQVIMEDLQSHIDTIQKYEIEASNLREDYSKFSNNSPLKNIVLPEKFDVTELYESYHIWTNTSNDYEYYKKHSSKANITIPKVDTSVLDKIQEPIDIRNDYEQYCVNIAEITKYNEDIQELKTKQEELQQKLDQIKVCPTCGRPMEE